MKLLNKKVADFRLSADSDLNFLLPRHLMHEFDYARTLEQGVIAETEPEFNHQYRVTLRRIRSLLLLLKPNFCPFEFKLLKPNLKLLMKQTNTLRDLDVFLIDREHYLNRSPEYQDKLASVFDVIETQQIEALKSVRQWLTSDSYLKTCVMIENSLRRASQYEVDNVDSIVVCSNKRILHHYKLVSNACKGLNRKSNDGDVHQLRIECKKLRYLLEYFTPLYVPNQGHLGIQHRANVKQLKQLQDRLGAFNDTSNQLDFFRTQQNDKQFTKTQRKAIGQLITLVEKDHQTAKLAIFADLKTFKREIKRSDALAIYA
ncbi:CHAD domain-containing protein [Vibrio owensii]|uniref:CHAD domain-containing protein n=1 Tax=Vibrio owensii TaxID=696485 RepID=UPI00105076A0|nr:CHAD domain-containing protein [Vibrio owensii]TDE25897.1 CHAD domain-containing protein [Vibrio owensii]